MLISQIRRGWKNVEQEVLTAKHTDKNIEILRAKSLELEYWKLHHVYEEVENKEQIDIYVLDGLLLKNTKMIT